MTPYEIVKSRFTLPFEGYNYQIETINNLAPLPKQGHYLAVGVGKTFTSTVSGLYKLLMGEAHIVIVLMPPILLTSWYRWLVSIPGVSALVYAGTPAQRAKMKFEGNMFVLMSYDIFKRDQDEIVKQVRDTDKVCLICDEATAIKNVESKNYKIVRDFSEGGHLLLLTGTPLAKILDGYAYVKLLASSIYRNFTQFKNVHIAEYDFWGTPTKFKNLPMLEKNLRVNAVRLLKEDVLTNLPPITYTPLHYHLERKHIELYKQLAEEQLLEYEDGTKLDATETTKLWHALQQIVMNYGHFSGNPDDVARGYEIIDEVLEELEGEQTADGHEGAKGKLIVFTNYKLTSRGVTAYCKKYGAVAAYSEVTAKQQQLNIDRFLSDPNCRVFVIQVQSGGYGLNLQDVCSDILFLEAPLIPIQFEQAVGRCYRNGQKRRVHVRVGIAQGTIQVHLNNLLLKKDELVNKVIRNFKDIRQALYGQ